jgi:hypothetical protein
MRSFKTTKSCSLYCVAPLIIYSDCMSSAKRKKPKRIDADEAAQKIERETGDIYDDKQRGEMLKADGITAAENGFMQGREMHSKKRKTSSHKDTVSVDLAADEYTED